MKKNEKKKNENGVINNKRVKYMHSESDITINNLSKIEGHASLSVKIRNGKVLSTKLRITENKRFYTQAIRGLSIDNIPSIVSRICGTCSLSHMTCCIKAIENALGVEPSQQTIIQRHLSMNATILRDHAMHLYFFCLPDEFGYDSVLEFDNKKMRIVKQGLNVKKVANNLAVITVGRAVHALYPRVGYFSNVPTEEQVKKSIKELALVRENVISLIDIFANSEFKFYCSARNVALVDEKFNFINGKIMDSDGSIIEEKDFAKRLHRVVLPYSQATGFKFKGREYIVGALSRINLNRDALHKDTLRDAGDYLTVFPSSNIFNNNLAQAIEMLHCIDSSIELLETTDFKQENPPKINASSGKGIGVIEAPRGTLFYELNIKNKIVQDGLLVIPTAQNQVNMERDISELVQQNLDDGIERHTIYHNIEKLIRAYDPCMSCASHFLKLKWVES